MRSEAKVGLIIFAAIAVLVVVYWFLGGLALRSASYPLYAEFKDVQRLSSGAAVRMAGVRIGVVDDITLSDAKLAKVSLRIQRGHNVPVGSLATVTTGGLIGEPYIEITPGEGPGALKAGTTMDSKDMIKLDELLERVGSLVDELQGATAGIRKTFDDPEVRAGMKSIIQDLSSAANSVAAAAQEVRMIAAENRPQIASIARNIEEASRRSIAIAEQVQNILAGAGTEHLPEILANAKETSASLARASEGLEKIATDQQLAEDIRVTASEARGVAERTGKLLGRVEEFADRLSKKKTGKESTSKDFRSKGLTADAIYDASNDLMRVDLNYDFRLPNILGLREDPSAFYRVGLFDITEDAKVNLQRGKLLDNHAAFRYGLYASRLGVGYDWRLAANPSLHIDLYGLNDPQLEVRALYDISPRWGLWFGLTDAFDERNLMIGGRMKW